MDEVVVCAWVPDGLSIVVWRRLLQPICVLSIIYTSCHLHEGIELAEASTLNHNTRI